MASCLSALHISLHVLSCVLSLHTHTFFILLSLGRAGTGLEKPRRDTVVHSILLLLSTWRAESQVPPLLLHVTQLDESEGFGDVNFGAVCFALRSWRSLWCRRSPAFYLRAGMCPPAVLRAPDPLPSPEPDSLGSARATLPMKQEGQVPVCFGAFLGSQDTETQLGK